MGSVLRTGWSSRAGVDGQVEGVPRHDVLVVDLLLAEQVADPLLGGPDVLGELPDPDVARHVRLVAAVGPGQALVVVDAVGGDQLGVAGHDVGAHRVVDPARLALLEGLVIAGVVPGEHLGLHAVAEHLLVPLDHLLGGRAVDADGFAVLVDFHAPQAPEDGAARGDGVVVLGDGDTHRVPHLLQLLSHRVQVLPGVGDLETRLLEEILPVGGDEEGVVLGHGAPRSLDVGRLLGRRHDLAVLLLQLAHHVGHVGELGLVEPGEVHAHLDEVMTGLGLHFRGVLGGLLGRGDVVDPILIPVSLVKRWPISASFLSEAGAKLFQHRYVISRCWPRAGGMRVARIPARPVPVVATNWRRVTRVIAPPR